VLVLVAREIAFNFLFNNHPAFGTPPKKNQEGKSVTERSFSSFFQGGVPRRMSGEVVICLKAIFLRNESLLPKIDIFFDK